jgi:hypothetical protein
MGSQPLYCGICGRIIGYGHFHKREWPRLGWAECAECTHDTTVGCACDDSDCEVCKMRIERGYKCPKSEPIFHNTFCRYVKKKEEEL